MEFLGINIVEHASVPVDEVWIIHKNEAPQVPADLRGNVPVPFILTGDATRARHLMSLVRAIDSQYVNSGASRMMHRFPRRKSTTI
ncbi:MAG: hypothetical protein M3410_10080 [Acidobacteriota bacterium]|nr:hypothetical protein [Acidobacteriota bacterium]